ncbi:MAG: hypothetical protein E4H03_05890 [Myxococcales bacterium]|nr:MAG: hypothetical protein E4H03_05890 [Myxococcales bacterium]
MRGWKRLAIAAVTSVLIVGVLEIGAGLSIPGIQGFISTAEAVLGRPLTPVSVAGVARRTARRKRATGHRESSRCLGHG